MQGLPREIPLLLFNLTRISRWGSTKVIEIMQECQEHQLWLSKHISATKNLQRTHDMRNGTIHCIWRVHVSRTEGDCKPKYWGQFNISSVITTEKRCEMLQSRHSTLNKENRNAIQHRFKISAHVYPDSAEFTSSFPQSLAPCEALPTRWSLWEDDIKITAKPLSRN